MWLLLGTYRPSFQEFSPLCPRLKPSSMGLARCFHIKADWYLLTLSSQLCQLSICVVSFCLPKSLSKLTGIGNIVCGVKVISTKKGSCLAGWEPACRPKTECGLGIVNIQTQEKTLLLKFMDKFYNHADVPSISLTWSKLYSTNVPPHARCPVGSFWWKDVLKLYPDFTSWQHASPT